MAERRDLTGIWTGLLAALIVLGPSVAPGRLIGDEGLDVWSHVWGEGWVGRSLLSGHLPWRDHGLAWPDGGVLWYIDPLGALVALPFVALTLGALGHLAVQVAQIALAAVAGRALGRALGGSGWVSGIGLATTPFLLGELHNGITEASWLGLVPAAGAAAARRSPWAGVWVGLAFASTPYHGLSALILVLTLSLWGPGAQEDRRAAALRLGRAALTAALVAAPFLWALHAAMADPSALTRKPAGGDNWPVFRINAVDPIALLRPGHFWTVNNHGPLEAPFRRTPYLGLGLLTLAALALARDRRRAPLLIPLGVGVALSLGPYLWVGGDFVRTSDGSLVALPFRALLGLTGVSMDHPLRFIGGALTALAGLADAALPLRSARRLAPVLAGVVAFEQLLLAPSVWPLVTSPAQIPEVYAALPADGAAIIDLPADRGDSIATNRYLYWSGAHGRAIPYAAKVGSQGFPSMNPALRAWTSAGRLTATPIDAPGAVAPGSDLSEAVRALAEQGFGWVVLHPELLASPELEQRHREEIDPWLGEPERLEGCLVWRIPGAAAQGSGR